MTTFELLQKIIDDLGYKVIEDNGERLVFNYQFSHIHLWINEDDDHFLVMAITGFADVNEDNFADIIMKCHKLNEELKQVKFYTIDDMTVVTVEFYFLEEKDLKYQIKQALRNLASAKGKFKKLNN
jgi:hypothetical protein